MSTRSEFNQLIEQLTYLDHEYDTDVTSELTEVIAHGKAEGLSAHEIIDLVEDRISSLKRQRQLVEEDQLEIVNAILEALPDVLDA